MHTIYKFVQIVYIISLSPAIRLNHFIDKAFPKKDQLSDDKKGRRCLLRYLTLPINVVLPGLKSMLILFQGAAPNCLNIKEFTQ